MPHFVIRGASTLNGTIPIYGSKNAALPLLAASLLTGEELVLENIPAIDDVDHLLTILKEMGVEIEPGEERLTLRAGEIHPEHVPTRLVGMLRGSILLLGALLARNKSVSLLRPGGDIIGARPIDVHLDAFRQLHCDVTEEHDQVIIDGAGMKAGRVILREFSVTATENVMLAASLLPGTTTIYIAAAEPHVVALAQLLNAMGAHITGAGTHTITVQGVSSLKGATYRNIPDVLEAGFFILLAAATKSTITIDPVPVDDLMLFFKKLDDIGIRYQAKFPTRKSSLAAVTIKPKKLKAFRMQSLPHPGIATDLQPFFSVVATQASGTSLIHEPLYEGRFKHILELQKMGADAIVCDPHRVIINGPTQLRGKKIPSLDIRAGATLIMAGLVAEGETIIDQAEIIDRGYANLTGRLRSLGALIERKE